MLSKRIIPQVLVRGRQLIKGKQFKSWRSVGVAMQAMKIHAMREVDELMLLDISATAEGRGPDLSLIEELSETCFVPLTVGGGIRTVDDARAVLRAGADKVAVCSAGLTRIREISDYFGSSTVVGVVDYDQDHMAYTDSGTRNSGSFVLDEARYMQDVARVGEILLQSINREGTMLDYDTDIISLVSTLASVPVIAAGGCSSYENMKEAFDAGADACAVGALFQFTDSTPKGAAEYLDGKGVKVRLK